MLKFLEGDFPTNLELFLSDIKELISLFSAAIFVLIVDSNSYYF